ncbi:hypothetical protein WA026_002230 [Henosepilachna vigintioctopunctata]|uniref:Uncharacterized protein n=1 Tax=Henosepilachna vigintioctopunctata TaxID=420089 RepID=A0AAW1U167_9CUCU
MYHYIIKVLKKANRTRLIHRYLQVMEDPDSKPPLTVHDALLHIAAASEAIKLETTQNCFKKVGFRNNGVDVELEVEKSRDSAEFS